MITSPPLPSPPPQARAGRTRGVGGQLARTGAAPRLEHPCGRRRLVPLLRPIPSTLTVLGQFPAASYPYYAPLCLRR